MVVKKIINLWQLYPTQPNPFHRRKFRTQPNSTQPMGEPNPWPCLCDHVPRKRQFVCLWLVLATVQSVHQHTKFEASSFIRHGDSRGSQIQKLSRQPF